MNVYATSRTTTPMKLDAHAKPYEGKPVTTRSARCREHNRTCSSFIGVNRAEGDGEERWVFWCSGEESRSATEQVVARAVGHYFAARAPLDA